MAKVSVIIPFLNRQHTPKGNRSVFNQTYTDWKLILVDDRSTDDYWPSIQDYLKDQECN